MNENSEGIHRIIGVSQSFITEKPNQVISVVWEEVIIHKMVKKMEENAKLC